jgi:hypothetical protein
MATLPTFPISTASFITNAYTFDPLYASETISQSANIAAGLGVLKRGTVLCGPLPGLPITVATLLTTVVTAAQARVILAQDIDTTAGQVTGVVYTQGKFLDTAMTFTSQGAALDVAQLRQFGIYALTVEQRSGMLVPLMKLPATGGPLPQALAPKDAALAAKDEAEAIRAAQGLQPRVPITAMAGTKDPAWYAAAFGEREPTKEEQAREKAAQQSVELDEKQQKALDELTAKQSKEVSDLVKKQADERAQLAKAEADAIQQARQASRSDSPTPKK